MKSLRAWRLLAVAYVATPGSQPRANRPSRIFDLFSLKTRELLREFLDASGSRTLCIRKLKSKGLFFAILWDMYIFI